MDRARATAFLAFHSRSSRRIAALALLLVAGPAPIQAAEEILAYDSRVTVRSDGVLDVTETLRVRAENDQITHGIYRDFPLTFVDDGGGRHEVTFHLVDVAKDGRPEPYHTASNSDGIRIYAGEQDVVLSPGVYTYAFHYETGRQIRFLEDHVELFWNVTGNDWAFPIREATATVTLPGGTAPVRWTAYTGPFGARGQDYRGEVLANNALRVETTAALAPREGLSVVVEIPDGLVAPPTGLRRWYYWYLDFRRFILGGLGFAGVLAFYVTTWNAVGRDPPKGTIIPLFHPPRGISPALAAYIRQYGWSGGWREFTAAAISLAVSGLIVFDDSGKDIVLSRTAEPRPARLLPPGERAIFDWLEGHGGRVTIDRANGESVAKALASFKARVESENRNRFFRRNSGYFVFGLVLTAGSIALVLFAGGLREGEIVLLVFAGFSGAFVGAFLVPTLRVIFGPRNVRSVLAAALNLAALAFVVTIFGTLMSSAVQALPEGFAYTALDVLLANAFPFALVLGFATMNGLFYYLLRAPTAAGRPVMDRIEGLELYIRTAETTRLNLAGAPDFDTAHFERLLPYAIALGVEKPWSQAFAKAFAAAHPRQTAAAAYQPGWHGGRGWGAGDFGSALSSAVSSAQGSFASSVPAPSSSSSGFGGGGGSGGGGGGGGGGGW